MLLGCKTHNKQQTIWHYVTKVDHAEIFVSGKCLHGFEVVLFCSDIQESSNSARRGSSYFSRSVALVINLIILATCDFCWINDRALMHSRLLVFNCGCVRGCGCMWVCEWVSAWVCDGE